MPNREDLKPPIRVGDKIVQVGPLEWSGFKALVDALAKADLPLPNLRDEAVRQKLAALTAAARASGALSIVDLADLVYELVTANLPALYQWILKHPALVTALVRGASNLSDDEIAGLSTGEVLRVARAAYAALVGDGVFAEGAGFFGELLGMRSGGLTSGASSVLPVAADCASESKSASAPQPVGA